MWMWPSMFFANRVNSALETMLNDVIEGAKDKFPRVIPQQVAVKVHVFVVVGEKVIFSDNFEMQLLGKEYDMRRSGCEQLLHAKRLSWQQNLKDLGVTFWSDVSVMMQAIAHVEGEQASWRFPRAVAYCPHVGLYPSGYSSSSGPLFSCDRYTAQNILKSQLLAYGLPEANIPSLA